MALTSRLSHPPATTTENNDDPEDLFSSSLGIIFPDDVSNQHSSDTNLLLYTSPHLPSPLRLRLALVTEEKERYLFSHYVWNAGLLLAELVERDSLGLTPAPSSSSPPPPSPHPLLLPAAAAAAQPRPQPAAAPPPSPPIPAAAAAAGTPASPPETAKEKPLPPPAETTPEQTIPPAPGASPARAGAAPPGIFDVRGLRTLELGAGAGLPSIVAALVGAMGVVATDYPAEGVLEALRGNLDAAFCGGASSSAVAASNSPATSSNWGGGGGATGAALAAQEVRVEGHAWGDLSTPFAQDSRGKFDVVMAADVLWMPWHHGNLWRSIGWFLKQDQSSRAWVVGGFHTGRAPVAAFFEEGALAEEGLEVEHLWERDCDGVDREWVWEREEEEASVRKRWLAVGVLRRIRHTEREGAPE